MWQSFLDLMELIGVVCNTILGIFVTLFVSSVLFIIFWAWLQGFMVGGKLDEDALKTQYEKARESLKTKDKIDFP